MEENVENILGKDGALSNLKADYEFRNEQLIMSNSILEALNNSEHIIVEAGTGIGKSLSYLTSIVLWLKKSGKRAVISTYSKALQEQLKNKDLPLLKKMLNFNEYTIFYGSNNYLCLRRYSVNDTHPELIDDNRKEKEFLENWVNNTKNGILLEIENKIGNKLKHLIYREAEGCLRNKCSYFKECYYYKAKTACNSSKIIVVNHNLFFANMATEKKLLPAFNAVVLDEAHLVEEVSTRYLAESISNSGIEYMLSRVLPSGKRKKKRNFLASDPDIIRLVDNIRIKASLLFDIIKEKYNPENTKRVKEKPGIDTDLGSLFKEISDILFKRAKAIENENYRAEVYMFAKAFENYSDVIFTFLDQTIEDYVYWVEKNKERVTLNYAPINVADRLSEEVFTFYDSVILTSATLSTNKNFDFLKERLGISECKELILDAPFDYMSNLAVYVNPDIPQPQSDYSGYTNGIKNEIKRLLKTSEGRAFVLFTSYNLLRDVYRDIKNEFDYKIFCQGELSLNEITTKFRQDINSILMGTMTFWQGVDMPGKTLSLVIITRLPFQVPDNPIVEARIENMLKNGIEPFRKYQLPQAAILLKQGFGRLIRNKNDKGIVAVLDSRLVKKNYGGYFRKSLPECNFISEIEDISQYLF